VVLADGRVINGLTRLRKDNTGYDLRNLMIGSEGTLGVITAAALKLFAQPADTGTALMAVGSPSDALALLAMARAHVGEGLSAFELMHRTGPEFLAEKLPDIRLPFADIPEWFVLIDLGLPRGLKATDALEALFTAAFEAGLVQDGVIAQSQAQRHAFWEVREQIPEANRRVGSISSHDISLPLGGIAEFIARGTEMLVAIWAMATCITMCFQPLAATRASMKICAKRYRKKCMIWCMPWVDRSARNMGLAGLRWAI
jgi:FAD/FMN-containing dehydrogenase